MTVKIESCAAGALYTLADIGDPGCMEILLDEPVTSASLDDQRPSLSSSLARLWTVCVAAWALLNFVQLRIAIGLIDLAGLERGRPIDEYDHFSQLPELKAAFDSATLTIPNLISWVMMLMLSSATGAAIAFGILLRNASNSRRTLVVMGATWAFAVLVGMTHFEMLDLLSWLQN